MERTEYKFGSHNASDLLERGANRYGTNSNGLCECPVCYGGGKMGLFACNNCKGTGTVENAGDKEGKEVIEESEEGKSPVKDKKKVGPYEE